MAQVIQEAVESGIAHGTSVAVGTGLISPDEALHTDEPLDQARSQAAELIKEEPYDMPPWRQYLVGELMGMAVLARRGAGTLDQLSLSDVRDHLTRWWEIIDRF